MIKIYTSSSNHSSRKVVAWLNDAAISFIERRIDTHPFNECEIKELLALTNNGFEDLLSVRSFMKLNKQTGNKYNLEEMTVSQLVSLMVEYPKLVRRPLVLKEQMLIVGYSDQKIRMLISKQNRKAELKFTLERTGAAGEEVC